MIVAPRHQLSSFLDSLFSLFRAGERLMGV